MTKTKIPLNYLNNQQLYEEFMKWTDRNGKIPDSIGVAIMQISNNLARCGKFAGYTWKSDMIGDAIVACVRGAKNFDCNKSQNPFAFLTSIAFNAFRRRINIEHQHLQCIEDYKRVATSAFMVDADVNGVIPDEYNDIQENIKNVNWVYEKRYGKNRRSGKYKKSHDYHIDTESLFGNEDDKCQK